MNSAGRTVSKFDKKGHGGTVQLDLGISKVVKAGPGDYTVRLTIDQRKDIVVEQALTVAAQGTMAFASSVDDILATGVVYGQTIPIRVEIPDHVNSTVKLEAVNGRKKVALAKKLPVTNGSGTFGWTVDDTFAEGDWILRVTDLGTKKNPRSTRLPRSPSAPTPRCWASIGTDPTAAGSTSTTGTSVAAAVRRSTPPIARRSPSSPAMRPVNGPSTCTRVPPESHESHRVTTSPRCPRSGGSYPPISTSWVPATPSCSTRPTTPR
ncbi:MAG: hypothetical protein R2705_01540 [Ilumatobacteraceae bacterium]